MATEAHKGQSMLVAVLASAPSLSIVTIFMPPVVLHTICVSVGCTMGAAMAAPMNKANHTSTKRAMNLWFCTLNMWRIIAEDIPSFSFSHYEKNTPFGLG